jgi:hypothetical protein
VLQAIRTAYAEARERAWALASGRAPGADGSLIMVDVDAGCASAEEIERPAGTGVAGTAAGHPG